MRRWTAFALLVLALNFAWEMMQAKWFASMHGLPPIRATLLCFRAALGDLVITAIGFEVFALSTARWSYGATMPTLFGIGVLPLLQWLLLPITEVWLYRAIFRCA